MGLRVTIVSAETFEFDSRSRRMAHALAADGHSVRVVALSGAGLPTEETMADGLRVTRLDLDRRITSALRPLPSAMRSVLARAVGVDPDATILPIAESRGVDRLLHPLARILEVAAHVRRSGPWARAIVAAAPDTDVFQTQALIALPAVRQAARRLGGQYVYDVADYQTEAARMSRLTGRVRWLLKRTERRLARQASGVFAVSEPVATLVAGEFGIPKPPVLMNCQPAWRPAEPEPPSSTCLRDHLGLAPDRPIVLHHGQFKLDRGIEELVEAADHPVLRELNPQIVFLGYGRLQPFLEAAAAARPGRVFVMPAVPPDELLEWVVGADVCYLGCPPRTLNLRLTIPNKVFEAMMAGVPVVAATGTEQGRLVAAEEVGRTANVDSIGDVAAAIAAILALPESERLALRRHCRSVALNKYTWERQTPPLMDVYRRL